MGVKVREKVPGSGEWWVFINWRGVRRSKLVGPRETAETVAEQIRARLVIGDYNFDAPKEAEVTFRDYSTDWLENHIKALRRASTHSRYEEALRKYIWPAIGAKRIEDVKRGDVRDLLLKLHKAGKSVAILSLVRDVVSGIMNRAVDDELIQVNPGRDMMKALGFKRIRHTEVTPFTREEAELVLDTCLKKYPEYYCFMLTAFRTGMRLGEILALKWDDIDWHGRILVVRRSYRNQKISKTKTGRSRKVEMSGELYEALKWLDARRKEEALAAGRGELVEWIFHAEGGGPIAQNSIRYIWHQLLRRAGLHYVKFHTIRHTYASLLLSAGMSMHYVKEQLGHSSIQMTVDIYGHFVPSESKRGVDHLDRKGDNLVRRITENGK